MTPELIDDYERGPARLRVAVAGLTADEVRARPGPGLWSILEVVVHLADSDALDWHALARPRHTVVFYMAVSQLETIVAGLIGAGAPADRPAAIIERATLPEQRVRRAALADIARLARAEGIMAPALLVVGEVAAGPEHKEAIGALAAALRGVA